MRSYNPDKAPDPDEWLEMDESERISLVESYHRRNRIHLPNVLLHSTVQVIVENQLAMKDPVVTENLGRLQKEGLSRHDAIHAIAGVQTERLFRIMKGNKPESPEVESEIYEKQLRKLTAGKWLRL